MEFTPEEIATILAALRYWQLHVRLSRNPKTLMSGGHFNEVDPLTIDQIDDLCAKINLGGNGESE